MGAGGSVQSGGGKKSGGGSANSGNVKVLGAATAAGMSKKQKGKSEQDFKTICRVVFDEADRNGNNKLDDGEFWYVLESVQLNLNLSKDEIAEIRRLAEADGPLPAISYEQFVPMFRGLLSRVYAHNDNDWNDWCVCTDPKTNQQYYLNKRTGSIQKERPENFHENRVDEQSFEYLTLDDGVELTTTVNSDGKRMYMDWDSHEWKEIPAEWLEKKDTITVKTDFTRGNTILDTSAERDGASSAAVTTSSMSTQREDAKAKPIEPVDPRVGHYMHPTRGMMHTYQFENTRNTRIYYDNRVNNWARMPLAWERNVDEVKVMLDELDDLIPRWKNVNEQLLTLRECNYDLQDAIIFAEINWGYKSGDTSETAKLERTVTRAGFVVNGDDADEDLGVLSKAAARKIDKLTADLTAANERVKVLEKSKAVEEVTTLKQLKRENTKLDASMSRHSRKADEAQDALKELADKLKETQAKLSDTERNLTVCQADSEKVAVLEAQIGALNKGGGDNKQALNKSQQEGERLRTENTHLKMKVQQLKEQIDSPMKSSATVELLRGIHTKVKRIRQEKDAMAKEIKVNTEIVQAVQAKAISHAKGLELSVSHAVEEITVKYRAEVLQRKLLYNKVQELRGNIRVFLRVRKDDRGDCIMNFPDEVTVQVPTLQGNMQAMDFDRVYSPEASQTQVYSDTSPVILSVLDGYNVCLMAYGQTGSGKTHTMVGTPDPQGAGVNRRAIVELLKLCNDDPNLTVSLKATLAEVYNENVYCLLKGQRTPHKIKQGAMGVYAEGLTERSIAIVEDCTKMFKDGDRNRSVAMTSMNSDSSRSHLIFTIKVSALNTLTGVTANGQLTLVDLAGSERIARSEATGPRLVEAAAINKSLSALGQVFSAISQSAPHIPYRNSKLTHLLQDSLGGDSKTCMFIAASPLQINLSETLSTFSFGKQIRSIELGPAKKHTAPGIPGMKRL